MIRWLPFVFVPLVAWVKDATVVILALGTILALAQPDLRRAALAPPRFAPAVIVFVLFAAWTLASFVWAPALPMVNWAKACATIAMIALLMRGIAALPDPSQIVRCLLGAWAALFVLLAVERITGGYFLGLVRVGASPERNFDTLSPGLTFLTCLTFPVALMLWRKTGRAWMAMAVVIACFALGVTYRMDAAPIALVAGAIAFVCVWIAGRIGVAAVAGMLALVAVMWGTFSTLAWGDDLPVWLSQHFTRNWGLRVEIWHRVDELIHARPVLGYGFDAARVVGEPNAVAVGVSREVNFLHPHNGLLQVWLELGAVGVVLFLAWSALALLSLQRRAMDRVSLATTLATALAVSVFWEVSFGIWYGWWLAAIGLTFIALRLAIRPSVPIARTDTAHSRSS